jgi:hypothetical protein
MKLVLSHIVIFFLLLPLSVVFGQTFEIAGLVSNLQDDPVAGATIVLYEQDSTIIGYTTTNEIGAYKLNKKTMHGYFLEVSQPSYITTYHTITSAQASRDKLTINFKLTENVNQLDEIILISPNIPKDTVNLDLEKLNLFEDNNLKEILEKIPNFKIGDNGSIIYNGKAIEKILVNNKASFINQNTIALESIEKKIIEGISVINNYQGDFTLNFKESQESVLNIATSNLNQNILTGSVTAKYGIDAKYSFYGRLFLFSKNINTFLRTNTNNIGDISFNYDEINKLIGNGQPLSPYMIQGLNTLFSSNENLAKDFLTTSDLTFRKQTSNLKISGTIYHIAPNRTESLFKSLTTVDNSALLRSEIEGIYRSNAIIALMSASTKISTNTIASFDFHSNFINVENTNSSENQLIQENRKSSTLAKNDNNVLANFGKFGLASKLSKSIIIKTAFSGFYESDRLFNGFSVNDDVIINSEDQKNKFKKQDLTFSFDVDMKLSNYFMPSISSDFKGVNEKIDIEFTPTTQIKRHINDYSTSLTFYGDNIFKKFDYEFKIGINTLKTEVSSFQNSSRLFYPIEFNLNYESRLNRLFFDYRRKAVFNDLESGINTIQPFNQVVIGNLELPSILGRVDHLEIGYNYNNLFDGMTFSMALTYDDARNELAKGFVAQENGITTLSYFATNISESYQLNGSFSKTFLQQNYPIKLDFQAKLKKSNIQIDQNGLTAFSEGISPSLKIESISKNLFNFRISSRFTYNEDIIDDFAFKSTFLNSSLALMVKNEKWYSKLSFIQEYNVLNEEVFKRFNINFNMTYTIGKMILSLDGRHLEELFAFIDNTAFNSQLSLQNGLVSNLVRNASLNYLIIGIKYNL